VKRFLTISILFIFTAIFIGRCEIVYEPKNLENSDKIAVINGTFDDTSSEIIVNAQYARGFDESSILAIKNAKVFLYDNVGNQYAFEVDSLKTWKYKLNVRQVLKNPDFEYHISLETVDGERYESVPAKFPPSINVTGINAIPGNYEKVTSSASGKIITKTLEGIYVNASVLSNDNNPRYVRFKNNIVTQSYYSQNEDPFPITWRCVKYSALNTNAIAENSLEKNGLHMILDRELGFLEYYIDFSTRTESTSARILAGWIVISDVYSINENTFNYYKKIENQISGTDGIFDPVPSQIKGNMFCVTNPEKTTLGIFEITRRVRKYNYFYWLPGHSEVTHVKLDNYHAPDKSMCVDTMPDFDWIVPN
jgi:hypothetical protein